MNNVNWTNIISWNSSQYNAFEQLVCMLFENEIKTEKDFFYKKGIPDGGLEACIRLEDNSLIGIQAKWFLNAPQDNQWQQIDKSMCNAISNHYNLIKCYLAMPIDMPDGSTVEKKSCKQKWDDYIIKWKEYSKEKNNRDIEFIYWGDYEINKYLFQEKNRHLYYAFFNKPSISLVEHNNHLIEDNYSNVFSTKVYSLDFGLFYDNKKNILYMSDNNSFLNKLTGNEYYKGSVDLLHEKLKNIDIKIAQLFFKYKKENFNIYFHDFLFYLKVKNEKINSKLHNDIKEVFYTTNLYNLDYFPDFQYNVIIVGSAYTTKSNFINSIIKIREEANLDTILLKSNILFKEISLSKIITSNLFIGDYTDREYLSTMNVYAKIKGINALVIIEIEENKIEWARLKLLIKLIISFNHINLIITMRPYSHKEFENFYINNNLNLKFFPKKFEKNQDIGLLALNLNYYNNNIYRKILITERNCLDRDILKNLEVYNNKIGVLSKLNFEKDFSRNYIVDEIINILIKQVEDNINSLYIGLKETKVLCKIIKEIVFIKMKLSYDDLLKIIQSLFDKNYIRDNIHEFIKDLEFEELLIKEGKYYYIFNKRIHYYSVVKEVYKEKNSTYYIEKFNDVIFFEEYIKFIIEDNDNGLYSEFISFFNEKINNIQLNELNNYLINYKSFNINDRLIGVFEIILMLIKIELYKKERLDIELYRKLLQFLRNIDTRNEQILKNKSFLELLTFLKKTIDNKLHEPL